MERDWHIINHWEDQFCRDVSLVEIFRGATFTGHSHDSAGTTPQICPVDSIVNTSPKREATEEVTLETLDPCVWKYVLSHDDLATFRLNARSDVIGIWQVDATTYAFNYYFQVKIKISGCGFKPATSKSKRTYLGLQANESSYMINQSSCRQHNGYHQGQLSKSYSTFHVLRKFALSHAAQLIKLASIYYNSPVHMHHFQT